LGLSRDHLRPIGTYPTAGGQRKLVIAVVFVSLEV